MQRMKDMLYRLLRRSESIFKTDMVYLARGTFWLSAGQTLSSVATFLLAIAFANLLPKETYGTYKYILSIVGILAITNLRGMMTAIVQAVARGHEGVLIPVLRERIRWGSLGGIASAVIGIYYYFNGNFTLAISFGLIAVFIPFFDSFEIYDSYLQGKKLFGTSVFYTSFGQTIYVTLLISVLFLTSNLYIILFTYFAVLTTIRLVAFLCTIKKFPPNASYDDKTLIQGRHRSFVDILATVFGSIDNPILFHYLGAAEVAVYTFAMAPAGQIQGFIKRIPALATPKMAERSIKEIDPMLKKRALWLFLFGLIVAGAYSLFAEYFFNWFFPQYLDAIWYSQIFALSIPLVMAQSIVGPAINAKLTLIPKKMIYLLNLPGIVGSIFLFMLIGRLGITGAIISRLLTMFATLAISGLIWHTIKMEERKPCD